ncbi:MAG TPA: beta-1,6-N-acetylglucosaminyltransferase [Steroidobacteraceae bacterium]|nr:beta-1,6-N-acetylglucosaminyltransferase [Steroidobacteraceae bacterium]
MLVKICYVLLLHHKFEQAARLIRRLSAPGTGFVLHVDRGAERVALERFRGQLQGLEGIVYAERVRARWGSYAQALAIMRSVEAAVRRPERYDRYVLLSGQDYPLVCSARIAQFFRSNLDSEYIEAYPLSLTEQSVPGWGAWTPYYRFRRYHVFLGRRHRALPWLRRGPPPQVIHHGSTWWALTRPAMEFIAQQFHSNRRLRRYLRTGFLVDEVYVPTLLMGSAFAPRVSGHNLTHAEWTPTSGPHPKTLGLQDLPALRASGKLFARKFDESQDAAVLNELDRISAEECVPTPEALREQRHEQQRGDSHQERQQAL